MTLKMLKGQFMMDSQGGFRESDEGTQYWERVLMLRRLSISTTILIPNAMIRLSICLALCLVFLLHHAYTNPFVYHISNKAETFSLCLLCAAAAINLLKATLTYVGTNPEGPQVEILKNLELFEIMLVVFLIVFILSLEAANAISKRAKKAGVKQKLHQMLLLVAHAVTKLLNTEADPSKSDQNDLELETVIYETHPQGQHSAAREEQQTVKGTTNDIEMQLQDVENIEDMNRM